MEKITQKDIDWLLNLNRAKDSKNASVAASTKKKVLLQVCFGLILFLAFTVLPFFVLIRNSVFLNVSAGFNGWISLSGGAISVILLLLMYMLFLFRKIRNRKLLSRFSFAGVTALVIGFCVYGIFYLSSVNAKSDEIQQVYRSLHPVLRVAVATTTLADSDLVITDIKRSLEDYANMGLPLNQQSLHFVQESGYVHAIDLRTKGRWEIRNFLLRNSLELMGLKTIRHVGTADHLHVALSI